MYNSTVASKTSRIAADIEPVASALQNVMSYEENRDLTVDWLVLQIIDSTRNQLEMENLSLIYNRLEQLDSKKLESLVIRTRKIASNPSSEGSLRKTVGDYKPRHHRRPRPHRPQRKRGYDDKGSMADPTVKALRQINESVHVSIYYLQDTSPTLLSLVTEYGRSLLSKNEDYVDLSRMNDFVDFLEEERLLSKRALWEIDELVDYVHTKS